MAIERASSGLSIYRGGTLLSKVYRGENLIWGETTLPHVPMVSWTVTLRKAEVFLFGQDIALFGSINSSGQADTSVLSGLELPASWMANSQVAYLRHFLLSAANNSVGFQLHTSDSGTGSGSGPDLGSELETTLQIEVTVGSSTLNMVMNSGSTDDTSEPYTFIPSNGSELNSFVNGLSNGTHSTTITLTNPN